MKKGYACIEGLIKDVRSDFWCTLLGEEKDIHMLETKACLRIIELVVSFHQIAKLGINVDSMLAAQ